MLALAVGLSLSLLVIRPDVGAGDGGASPEPAPPDADASPASRVDPEPLFHDVVYPHPFFVEIGWLVDQGITSGYPDGTFRPTGAVTRQAMAAFLHRYAMPPLTPGPCSTAPFTDVPADHAFCQDIAWLVDTGIADGFPDGSFHPTAPVSRQAMAVFLERLATGPAPPAGALVRTEPCSAAAFPDVPADHAFCPEIAWLFANGIAGGFDDGGFHPTASVSRQATAAFLYRHDAVFNDGPVPSAGCGTSTQGPVEEESRTLDVEGVTRTYLLTAPTAHDGETPVPLVLDFHGLGEGAVVHTMMSEFSPIAESEGFAVVFPQGTGSPVCWNSLPDMALNPDLRFVDQLLDQLGADLCIDRSRVYAAGLSNGGFMTSIVGCTLADRFAAIAPVAGAIHPTSCAPARPIPVLAFHGTADPILFFNGGVGSIGGTTTTTTAPVDLHGPGYPANVAAWAAGNGCDPADVDTPVTDEVLHRVYGCPMGADVEFFIILEGGHAWPGSAFSVAIASIVGYTTLDIHASEEAWSFFQRFHLPHSMLP